MQLPLPWFQGTRLSFFGVLLLWIILIPGLVAQPLITEPLLKPRKAPSFQTDTATLLVRLQRHQRLLYDCALTDYLQGIARELLSPRGIEAPPVYAYLDHQPAAFWSPNDAILVSIALPAIAKQEEGLQFVVAHELAHFLLKHRPTESQNPREELEQFISPLNQNPTRYQPHLESQADSLARILMDKAGWNAEKGQRLAQKWARQPVTFPPVESNLITPQDLWMPPIQSSELREESLYDRLHLACLRLFIWELLHAKNYQMALAWAHYLPESNQNLASDIIGRVLYGLAWHTRNGRFWEIHLPAESWGEPWNIWLKRQEAFSVRYWTEIARRWLETQYPYSDEANLMLASLAGKDLRLESGEGNLINLAIPSWIKIDLRRPKPGRSPWQNRGAEIEALVRAYSRRLEGEKVNFRMQNEGRASRYLSQMAMEYGLSNPQGLVNIYSRALREQRSGRWANLEMLTLLDRRKSRGLVGAAGVVMPPLLPYSIYYLSSPAYGTYLRASLFDPYSGQMQTLTEGWRLLKGKDLLQSEIYDVLFRMAHANTP